MPRQTPKSGRGGGTKSHIAKGADDRNDTRLKG